MYDSFLPEERNFILNHSSIHARQDCYYYTTYIHHYTVAFTKDMKDQKSTYKNSSSDDGAYQSNQRRNLLSFEPNELPLQVTVDLREFTSSIARTMLHGTFTFASKFLHNIYGWNRLNDLRTPFVSSSNAETLFMLQQSEQNQ